MTSAFLPCSAKESAPGCGVAAILHDSNFAARVFILETMTIGDADIFAGCSVETIETDEIALNPPCLHASACNSAANGGISAPETIETNLVSSKSLFET
jgi:hypothetical protein